MFEYGAGYLEQNEIALAELREMMSPEAVIVAEAMADDLYDLNTGCEFPN